jgi:hypothetical protein
MTGPLAIVVTGEVVTEIGKLFYFSKIVFVTRRVRILRGLFSTD